MKTRILSAIIGGISLAAMLLVAPAAKAVTYNLTTAGSSVTINGAIFDTTITQSTGSGVINPFLRLQGNGSETGLNSNEGNADVLADTKTGTWTHDITLADIGTKTILGVNYYVFLLDINQSNPPLISFDTFQLYTRPTSITDGNQDTLAVVQSGGTLRYNMDVPSDNVVQLDYSLNSGSGSGDLWVYVPVSDFVGVPSSSYLYLYTQFGLQGGDYASNDGYEEWATITSSATSTPDGGITVALVGLGLLGIAGLRRRLAKK